MRLTEDVAIVGGGSFTGFGLSADLDSHVYLLDGGSGYALVDCGMGTSQGLERVLARIESVGVDPAAIDRLLLTHYHTDHAGGAAVYRERLSLQVSIGADVQTALETPDHEMTQFTAGSAAGAFPAAYEYPAVPWTIRSSTATCARLGGCLVRYVSTPGHCAGHGSYLVTGGRPHHLLAGDAVFAQGRLFLQGHPRL